MKYWLISLERVNASNAFDAQITHGTRLLTYRFTVEFVSPFHVINADPWHPPDFPGTDGGVAARHLHAWLSRAYDGGTLTLPIDLTEVPRDEPPGSGAGANR